jgi:transposase
MTTTSRKDDLMNEDARRAEARQLRVDPGMSRKQLMERFGVGNNTLSEWLSGLETPEWTRRPNAKDDLRDTAMEMRHDGYSVPQIAIELGVSKSTAYLWTKHLPLDRTPADKEERKRRHMEHMREARWEPYRKERDAARVGVTEQLSSWVGELSDRELLLLGATAYWCEGQKSKPWEPNRCRVTFINSDPGLILVFLRFLGAAGVDRESLGYRISIHESADVEAAGRWWAEVVGVPFERFSRPTLKTHNPSTVRHNVGDPYRGCLVIGVSKSRELYWKIEGLMRGITDVNVERGDASM